MKRYLLFALFVASAAAQSPPVPVFGPAGSSGGGFPFINSPAVIFSSDADKTTAYPETSGSSGVIRITSTVSLTATRKLILPLVKGLQFTIINDTTGGQSIQPTGASGTFPAVIPNCSVTTACAMTVATNGVNYVATSAASGGGISGSATNGTYVIGTGSSSVGPGSISEVSGVTTFVNPIATPSVATGTPSSGALAAIPSGAHGIAGDESATAGVPASGVDYIRWDATNHCAELSVNGGGETCIGAGSGGLPSQTVTFATSSGTFTAACQSGYTCTSLGGVVVINGTWLTSDGASINWGTFVPTTSQFCKADQTYLAAATDYNISSQPVGGTQFQFNFHVAAGSTSTMYIAYQCTPK